MDKRVRRAICICSVLVLLAFAAVGTGGCGRESGDAVVVLLDGKPVETACVDPDNPEEIRVYLTLNGEPLIDLPFGVEHTVSVTQGHGVENVVRITSESVYMESATCKNQDCVNMGMVTRDNLEMRVMGGFIICLPQKISVEVRGA